MARAKTDPTRNDNAASKASSNWLLIIKDVFPRWCDRLGSSKDAGQQLVNLLCDRETRSANHRVDASGEEIPGTSGFLNADFWPGRLLWEPDADGGDDHLVVDYSDYEDIYWDEYSPGWRWEFYVRRIDVERWEHLHPELVASPPRPPASHAPDQQQSPPTEASKPAGGAKPGRKPSFEQAARDATIQHRLNNGVRPGSTVQWDVFCHRVRADCGVADDSKNPKFKRGFKDDRITRVTRVLMKRQA